MLLRLQAVQAAFGEIGTSPRAPIQQVSPTAVIIAMMRVRSPLRAFGTGMVNDLTCLSDHDLRATQQKK
jgi:hypothetical protein